MDKKQFRTQLETRLAKRLETENFNEITVYGSKLRFEMALAINGYPFELPEGSIEDDFTSLLTDREYQSGKFDDVIDEVFTNALERSQSQLKGAE